VSEPSGTTNCPAGGLKVLSGPDQDGNNVLDAAEVTHTEYLCNGAPGAGSRAGISVVVGAVAAAPDSGKKKGKQKARAGATASPKQAARPRSEPAGERAVKAAPKKEKSSAARPAAAPPGWNSVSVNAPQLGSVAYKVERRFITLRFKNLSDTATVRIKYVVKWKANQNGNWVEDSTADGLSVRLKAQDFVDRDVRTMADEVRDVVVTADVAASD